MKTFKRNQITCYCAAYDFPHKLDSKACKELYNSELETNKWTDEMMDSYERDEAKAINLENKREVLK